MEIYYHSHHSIIKRKKSENDLKRVTKSFYSDLNQEMLRRNGKLINCGYRKYEAEN